MQPYSGSLLRLAVTTAVLMATLGAAFVFWQGSVADAKHSAEAASVATTVNPR